MPKMELTEEEAETIKALRDMDEESKEHAMTMSKVRSVFLSGGNEKGSELAELAGELHPEALLVYPLYRSCLVVPRPERLAGNAEMIAYHDPAWIGKEVNLDTTQDHREDLVISGQRSGVEVILDGDKLRPQTIIDHLNGRYWEEMCQGLYRRMQRIAHEYDIPEEVLDEELEKPLEEIEAATGEHAEQFEPDIEYMRREVWEEE